MHNLLTSGLKSLQFMVAGLAGAVLFVLPVGSQPMATRTEAAQIQSPNMVAWNALGTAARKI